MLSAVVTTITTHWEHLSATKQERQHVACLWKAPVLSTLIFRDPRRAGLHPVGLPERKWNWKGAKSWAPGPFWGQTVALSAVSVVSLPWVVIRKRGTACFSHKAVMTGLYQTSDTNRAPGKQATPPLVYLSWAGSIYWMRQNQRVENCWPAFPSASPHLLVYRILLLRSLITTVLPLNKTGILFIWGDCCCSRAELLARYKVNVLFNVLSRLGCGAVYSLPPPEGHYL